jgi:endonuclease/exonuclease/phosphatase family metal-dependent hydrolase
MLEWIKKQDADVLCFQEYVEPNTPRRPYNNRNDISRLGYPYSMVVSDYVGWKGTFQSGIAIFSKYPISDSIHIRYPGPKNFRAGESLIGADINFRGRKVRVFTTHLQSVLFQKNDYRNIEIIKNASDSMYEASKSVVKKLAMGYKFRGMQVDIVKKHLDQSPYPAILTGDFNDVPNSYTYFQMKGNRKDAFVEGGSGLGRSFAYVSPTLRIDYIMPSKSFEVLQYKRYFLPYSEHYPLIADVVLRDTAN